MMRLVIVAMILLMHAVPARAALLWNWSYSGNGISASGTFTTSDAPDGAGHFQIIRITGAENGVGITGLQSTGTAIPGNEPYAVDNLVSAVEPHLTKHGFGFSLANGNYANPFFKDSSYYEYLSVPPHVNGAGPEKSVSFSAAIVPEPSAASLMLTGLVGRISFAQIFRAPTNLNRSQLNRLADREGPDMGSTAAMSGEQAPSNHVLRATERAWRPREARMADDLYAIAPLDRTEPQ